MSAAAAASFPCNFRVGQKVLCVNGAGEAGADWLGDPPCEGTVYTIRGMQPAQVAHNGVEIICLYFEEIRREKWFGVELGYWHIRFRTLEESKRTTDISELKKLLNPANWSEEDRALREAERRFEECESGESKR